MKRRSFLKLTSWLTLFGSTALTAKKEAGGFLVRGDVAKKLREPRKVNQDIYDSIGTPNDPERATEYISSLYRSSRKAIGVPQEVTFQGFHSKPIPYIISGEGKTREEAWEKFWADFRMKTTEMYVLPKNRSEYMKLTKKLEKDIFWRRVVAEEENARYWVNIEKGKMAADQPLPSNYVVACRFSLGDFT